MTKKDKEIIILKSNILRPGEKFIITDKSTDGRFLPGSTGFISFVKGVDQQFPNVVHFLVVMTKKGKSGKERIEVVDMSAPIFELSLPEEELTMPGIDRRYFTRMEHVVNSVDNVHKMATYDFMGWILSRVKFIHKLNSKVTFIKVWPQTSAVLNNVIELPHNFSENPTATKEYYARSDIIDELVTVLNKTESKLAKCSIGYMYQTATLEMKAIRSLYDFYVNRSAQNDVLDILNDTVMYCAAKADILFRLHKSGLLTDQMRAETTAVLNSMLYTAT